MKTKDKALEISNPRLLAAVYFSLLAIIATIAIDTALYALGIGQLLPISNELFLAVIIAACFGALFGKRIVLSEKPFHQHVFFWAFLMVITALPFYTLGFLYLMREHHSEVLAHSSLSNVMYLYLFVLVYSFILVGVWLAIVAGFAAIYLREYLVYYILESLYQPRKKPVENMATTTKEKMKHHNE